MLTIPAITRLIGEASTVFQDELKRKQDSIDALHNNLRTTSAQVGEARRTLEALTEKLKAQQLARQKVANLSSASREEEYRLVQLENAHGRLDIPSANAWELRLTEVLSALRQQGGTGPAAAELAGNLPDASALRARIHALRDCSKQTKDAVAALQSQSKEKELKYRRLVSLCTRRPEVEVETLLETLTRAVESEKGELEITRVRRFLGGVEGVVH